MSDDFSLRNHIQKRKAQEIQRAIEVRQINRITGEQPRSAEPAKATQRKAPVAPAFQPESTTPKRFNGPQRQRIIILTAGLLIFVICLTMVLVLSSQAGTSSQVAYKSIPTVQASDVIASLKQSGLPITGVTTLNTADKTWQADQVIQFEVMDGKSRGHFTMLSYGSAQAQSIDFGAIAFDPHYKNQALIEQANILLIASSDTDKTVSATLDSHLTALLTAPYRDYYATAIP